MTWMARRWTWRLDAPLFLGMPPAGALNRCRPYLPARTMHGAVTAELARLNGEEKSKFPDYGKFGKEVGENCRFTYLYPAEMHGGRCSAWLPTYMPAKGDERNRNDVPKTGLRWRRMDGEKIHSDRGFRRRLLDSRPGTAIAPESGSASEGTLRETECISPWWRDPDRRGQPETVLLFGYVFLRNNSFRRHLDEMNTLFVGGDVRYGLGKIRRIEWEALPSDEPVFGQGVCLNQAEPQIRGGLIYGHAWEGGENGPRPLKMQGAKEFPGAWSQDKLWGGEKAAWSPGSFLEPEDSSEATWIIDNHGYWMYHGRSPCTSDASRFSCAPATSHCDT